MLNKGEQQFCEIISIYRLFCVAKFLEKQKAIILRKKGASISKIARELGVSKGSVSIWCRSIHLTKRQEENIRLKMIRAGHAGRMKGAYIQRLGRIERMRRFALEGRSMVGDVSKRDLLMLGIGLYISEGGKRDSRAVISNSDFKVHKLAMRWFESMGVKNEDFSGHINLNERYRRSDLAIKKEWSKLLRVELSRIKKTVFIKTPHKKKYAKRGSYRGVFQLRVAKSANLQYKILGLMDAVM
ncbi:MAG: hypothetical protein COU09_00645 [Candidatus Harrisonbacteria bacterium CG10_big_fil_rev_8_21_14_0_10_44_23]|uniref:Uncharacterized protein n=1 Tax=Candidatus Harrisonbacteria bacterium CG10_big_fil_rev_8_21_14_0_10_44_23 TaxID=1974585 RepID=A0A2H0UQQ8_9BACT|nr:MAG: hypothetical protein COU09_00645 [Candidatus Harrisonbacteria bacterium CG10_big_fil_rev_8_21_14_0_10_44_23]